MSLKRNIILNIIFVVVSIVFLILSFLIDFFFFLPILCICPFTFSTRNRFRRDRELQYNDHCQDFKKTDERFDYKKANDKPAGLSYCPICSGEIKEPVAKFCYHCGAKL